LPQTRQWESPSRSTPCVRRCGSSLHARPMAPTAKMASEKENRSPQEDTGNADEKAAIKSKEDQVFRFMQWWDAGNGAEAAATHPVLSVIDEAQLSEIISTGANYHTILTMDRLDGLQRRVGNSTDQCLEPLRKALQVRGGAKSQARQVGNLLFREALSLFEQSDHGGDNHANQGPNSHATAPAVDGSTGRVEVPSAAARPPDATTDSSTVCNEPIMLDEVWAPPRKYICSDSFPDGAEIAARAGPSKASQMVAKFPRGTEFLALGRVGDFLQFRYEDSASPNGTRTAYVPRVIGNVELLVAAPGSAAVGSAGTSNSIGASDTVASKPEGALDESWAPPRRFICSESFPEGAEIAARSGPHKASPLVAKFPKGTEFLATGRVGDYLEFRYEDPRGGFRTGYVPRVIGAMELLVPAQPDREVPTPPSVTSTPPASESTTATPLATSTGVPAAPATQDPGSTTAASPFVSQLHPCDRVEVASVRSVEALEARVAQQDNKILQLNGIVTGLQTTVVKQDSQIRNLQSELLELRAQLRAVANAFSPLSARS